MQDDTMMYLVDQLEDALCGRRAPSTVVHTLKTIPDPDINRIWSMALRRMGWPPRRTRPWWRRIWSNPLPPSHRMESWR